MACEVLLAGGFSCSLIPAANATGKAIPPPVFPEAAGRQAGRQAVSSCRAAAREGSGVLLVWIRTEREQPALLLSLPQHAREGAIPRDTESSTVSARGTKTSR